MDFNAGMNFVSGGEKAIFTKTPANVPAEYWDATPPTKPASRQGTSRGGGGSSNNNNKIHKRKLPLHPGPSPRVSDPAPQSPAPPKQKRRASGRKAARTRAIPRSYDECTAADRMLLRERDAGGAWKHIRPRWTALTGERTATSTLPNRYARIKSKLTVVNEEDNARLLQAKREVEDTFESHKWELIAALMERKGATQKYSGMALKRQYKKLMESAETCPPEGVRDGDFEGSEWEGSDDHDVGERRGGGGRMRSEEEGK